MTGIAAVSAVRLLLLQLYSITYNIHIAARSRRAREKRNLRIQKPIGQLKVASAHAIALIVYRTIIFSDNELQCIVNELAIALLRATD